MIKRWFLSHPAALGESYVEHMAFACSFGFRLLGAGCACLIHALVPCLFERTGSRMIVALHEQLIAHRRASAPAPAMNSASMPGLAAISQAGAD